jgi:hypothetical protein
MASPESNKNGLETRGCAAVRLCFVNIKIFNAGRRRRIRKYSNSDGPKRKENTTQRKDLKLNNRHKKISEPEINSSEQAKTGSLHLSNVAQRRSDPFLRRQF